jgi:hypothetical protein
MAQRAMRKSAASEIEAMFVCEHWLMRYQTFVNYAPL